MEERKWACFYEDHTSIAEPAIAGLNSSWIIPEKLIASQRPCSALVKQHNIGEQFKKHKVGVVINLQQPHEHKHCGANALHDEGFTYLTTEFKDAGTEVQLHGWTDDSVPDDVEHIVKLMKIIDTFTNEGKSVFVHCHAGIGRTGIVCVCYLLWSKHPECDSPKAAIQHFLKVRTRGPNNLQRKFIKKFFEHIQSK